MRQHGRQIDDTGGLIDRRGLYGCNLMLAQGLADDIESTRQRSIAERLFSPARSIRTDSRYQRFLGIDQFGLGFG
jgi:hypothetical protein